MADRGSFGLGPRLDIQQLFIEAQNRWLRPAEICEILRNYQKFHISSEPPNRPPSGSLFLFDRKVLRYFRKDGHSWRKKKDGKTVKEAHEKLKVGSVDVLHCYYAHGEENENFQRRSYWMLERELMHIVFVHYLEVKGNRTTNSPSNSYAAHTNREASGNTDSTSPTSTLSSLCEDADSADSHQTTIGYQPTLKSQQFQTSPVVNKVNMGMKNSFLHPALDSYQGQPSMHVVGPPTYVPGDRLEANKIGSSTMDSQSLPSWEEVFKQCTTGNDNLPSNVSTNSLQPGIMSMEGIPSDVLAGGSTSRENFNGFISNQSEHQILLQNSSSHLPDGAMDQILDLDLLYDLATRSHDQRTNGLNASEPFYSSSGMPNEELLQNNLEVLLTDEAGLSVNDKPVDGNSTYNFIRKQPFLDGEEGLKKVDSFSRWISKELVEVDDLNMRSSSGLSWSNVECENVGDDSSLSPSLAQDQLFSIIDFSPKWAYADSKTEVYISGNFLKCQQEVEKFKWSCMFGEVEVPAEVLADGILCCYAPPHNVARVPFYITCSNRLACSEVREFDYLEGSAENIDLSIIYGGNTDEVHLHLQLESLLSQRPAAPDHPFNGDHERQKVINDILLLKLEDDNLQVAEPTLRKDLPQEEKIWQILQNSLKEKLYSWLLRRVAGGGKGPSVLDDNGQGVIHLAAALGYDWTIKPILASGVSINFRDANGWTALHWAAFCGREQTVVMLLSHGASPGAVTDPSPEVTLGRSPADLASCNGHKGISGFLAESSLTNYLQSLTVNDPKEAGSPEALGTDAVQTVAERTATPDNGAEMPDALSMKDSLAAMRNATQAANRIYQVFRMQSFRRKQLNLGANDEFDTIDERALSLVTARGRRPTYADGLAQSAAVQIQKKFRGWKKRKEFLLIRQRIVKIQAHVRGHQVRKQYRAITWSVGILEKVILRWRRKGSGLRGFRRDALTNDTVQQPTLPEEDEYDFLKEGRKQNEERMHKALTRVKSMFHNPEGRAQYRRLLNAVEGTRHNQASDMVVGDPNDVVNDADGLIDIDSLLEDDTFMSIAFE